MIDAARTSATLTPFSAPGDFLRGIDAEGAGGMIASASDVALILDESGLILDVAFHEFNLSDDAGRQWIGRNWAEVVTVESRPKIEELLRDATTRAPTRWRQVNHPTNKGADIPVRYSAIRYGTARRVLAVGRDLRPLAALQQRLADAQQGIEREYTRIRNAEKRYRLLFQLATEAALIVDSSDERIIEANPAAGSLFAVEPRKLVGQTFGDLFAGQSRAAARSFLAAARVASRVDNVHARLDHNQAGVLLTGSLYRQEGSPHFLVLLSPLGEGRAIASPEESRSP